MDNKNDEKIMRILSAQGKIFPVTDDDVERIKKNSNDINLPPFLDNPDLILGKIKNQKKTTKKSFIKKNKDREIQQGFSIAARNGEKISDEVKLKMKKDRETKEQKRDE